MRRAVWRWWRRPAGRRWPAVALLAALLVAGGAVAQAESSPAQANARAARTDADSLLASLNLPAGATRQAGEPAGDGDVLAQPFASLPITPNAVDDPGWWVVPGTTPRQVLQYVKTHPPAGTKSEFAGSGTVTGTTFQRPPISGELSIRWLAVEAVGLQGGSTGVRADGEVVWITPRPRSERIPSGARRLVVTETKAGQLLQGPFTFTSRRAIGRAATLLNALPAFQPGVYACPADFGLRVRVAFYRGATSSSAAPLAVAMVDPAGCGVVQLTLAGRHQPPLADGYTVTRRLSAALHVKLDTSVS